MLKFLFINHNCVLISMYINWMEHYYFANQLWITLNLLCIIPFLIACINRLRNPSIDTHLATDHLSRIFLALTCLFYVYDIVLKFVVDGGQSICQKAFYIHHISILNRYIPWWVNPIGFLHGFLVYFPDFEDLNYVYAVAVIYFQYSLYQKPFVSFPYYKSTRYAINGIWVFVVYLLLGDCSNFLPIGPD